MSAGYRRTRREAVVAILIWGMATLWALTASYTLGAEEPVQLVGGLPRWLVWGVLLPWGAAFLVHLWYSLVYVRSGGDR